MRKLTNLGLTIMLTAVVLSVTNACAKHHPNIEQPSTNGRNELKISHTGYTLSFNLETNCAKWVAWDLTRNEVRATKAKRNNLFYADPMVPNRHRVEYYAYKQTPYDRGHMCPAGDMKWNQNAMNDCFYMSNVCPQIRELNQNWWEHLERACRRWAEQEERIYICCGPIYENNTPARYIGKRVKVRVPDGFFKVVLSLQKGKEKAIGFIYTNTADRQTMESTAVSVDRVEQLTGYDFFPNVDDNLERTIEAKCNLRAWN